MSEEAQSRLARAVISVLRPLLRVLVRHEISHAQFAELARQAYVDVAYDYFSIPGRKMTYSRAAVLTGLSRKEVQRLVQQREADSLAVGSRPNRAIRVVNGWLGDPEFLDADGLPRVLPLQGDTASFAALVARYSGDITLGAVVDELERTGVVSRPDRTRVKLEQSGYIPRQDELEKVSIFAMCTADLMDTAIHNIEHGQDRPRLQRQLVYPDVPEPVAARFRDYSHEKSSALLQELNRTLSADLRRYADDHGDDNESAGPGKRLGLGIYYFENENEDDDDETTD